MSYFLDLKQEILDWANKPGTMNKFTTYDVYDAIHSAETPSQTSDALRSMWKNDKTLNREEFMDGNRKKFIYSLANVNVDKKVTSVNEQVASDIERDIYEINYDKELNKIHNKQQQIEIPNNFTIELRTPSGFVITIKSSDLKDDK